MGLRSLHLVGCKCYCGYHFILVQKRRRASTIGPQDCTVKLLLEKGLCHTTTSETCTTEIIKQLVTTSLHTKVIKKIDLANAMSLAPRGEDLSSWIWVAGLAGVNAKHVL